MTVWDKIIGFFAMCAGGIVGAMGGWTPAMTVLIWIMVADYITGCLVAMLGKSPKSESGRWISSAAFKGLLHKALVMGIIFLAAQLDKVVKTDAATFKSMSVFFYIATEGLSVVENIGLLELVPIPDFLRKALEVLRDSSDKPDDRSKTGGM